TNLRFLRWLVREPVVQAGEARTDTLDRIWPPDDWAERVAIPDEAWQEAAAALIGDGRAWMGGWRLNASPALRVAADGQTRSVVPGSGAGPGFAAILVDDTVHLDLAGRSVGFTLAPAPDVDAAARAAVTHGAASAIGPVDLVAPMPGAVVRVHVEVVAAVAPGDPVVTLEAMKMEHVVAAESSGRVGDVRVRAGDQVARRQLPATIEP
ncbi:MAG: hypothetical protein E4H24_06900, partial [Thermomicrobiales bacterium]